MSTNRTFAKREALNRIQVAGEAEAAELDLTELVLDRLPEEISELHALTELRLNGSFLKYEPQGLKPLTKLEGLRKLHLVKCNDLQNLKPVSSLMSLQELRLRGCYELQDIESLGELTALQGLEIGECRKLERLQPIVRLKALEGLILYECNSIEDILPIAQLPGLKSLSLHGRNLEDLRPITNMRSLQVLDIGGWERLEDLGPLVELGDLRHLVLLGCRRLRYLGPLAVLKNLESLDLTLCEQIQDFEPLQGLRALRQLYLHQCKGLQHLDPLAGLSNLERLGLGHCAMVSDLRPVSGLSALRNLEIRFCRRIRSLEPLSKLTCLRVLFASVCSIEDLQPIAQLKCLKVLDIAGCRRVQDLQPLAKLKDLQLLDLTGCAQIRSFRPLAGLCALRYLHLAGCTNLNDLRVLSRLTKVHYLDLRRCTQIKNMEPLVGLTELKSVLLLDTISIDCAPGAQPLASWHQLNDLRTNRLISAPSELGSKNDRDNALPRIRAWQTELASGEAENSIVKLFVLGNGRVGKTQICRRLADEEFDPTVPVTHGVDLGVIHLVGGTRSRPPVEANVWDFGGQDVYLGTHALFLDDRAIYLIAWMPECETDSEYYESGVPGRNWPLSCWMQYVYSLAGPQAPIIVAQTQCDLELGVQHPPIPLEHGFHRLTITSCSAKAEDGVERLQAELRSAAKYLQERFGKVRLPATWVRVGKDLGSHRDTKTISLDQFSAICSSNHSTASPEAVLDYLHRSGQVFWSQDVFDNQIVLDQAWVLDGVYALLEKETVLREIRRQAGCFSRQFLSALAWQDYADNDQNHFLEIMLQCQICFRVDLDTYLAPSLLPGRAAMKDAIRYVWRDSEPDAVVRLSYRFLHERVLRAVLCEIGRKAGTYAVYWAYGACFYDADVESTVRLSSSVVGSSSGEPGGSIEIEATGPNADEAAFHLIEAVRRIEFGCPENVSWEVGRTKAQSPDTDVVGGLFGFDDIQPARRPRSSEEKNLVYVSYAWNNESAELLDCIERQLSNDLSLVRDKTHMANGEWISRFMMEIGRADLVLVVLSEKYLRSPYCMRELLHMYNHDLGDQEELMQRIIPLVAGELKFSRAIDRDPYVIYWRDEHRKLNEVLSKRSISEVAEADRQELLALEDFRDRISDLLSWISDVLMPQGVYTHKEGVEAVIELLKRRLSKDQ